MNPNPLSVRRLIVPVVEAMSASFSLRTSASCSGEPLRSIALRRGKPEGPIIGHGPRTPAQACGAPDRNRGHNRRGPLVGSSIRSRGFSASGRAGTVGNEGVSPITPNQTGTAGGYLIIQRIRNPAGSPTARSPMGGNAPVPGASELADLPVSPSDERASAPGSSPAFGRDDRTVSELMICHPDARGPFAAADIIQECINRAPAFSSIEIPPGRYLLTHQVVVSTPLTIRTAGSGGTSLSCPAPPKSARCWLPRPTCSRPGDRCSSGQPTT